MVVKADVMVQCMPVGDAQNSSLLAFIHPMLWPGNGIKGEVTDILRSLYLLLSNQNFLNCRIPSLRNRLEELEKAAYPAQQAENSDLELQYSTQDIDIPSEFLSIEDNSHKANLSMIHQFTAPPTETHSTSAVQHRYSNLGDEIDGSTESSVSDVSTFCEHDIGC